MEIKTPDKHIETEAIFNCGEQGVISVPILDRENIKVNFEQCFAENYDLVNKYLEQIRTGAPVPALLEFKDPIYSYNHRNFQSAPKLLGYKKIYVITKTISGVTIS